MRKKIIAAEKKLESVLFRVNENIVLPFTEHPSIDKHIASKEREQHRTSLGATELFSIFTADIIKEEVLFTR